MPQIFNKLSNFVILYDKIRGYPFIARKFYNLNKQLFNSYSVTEVYCSILSSSGAKPLRS